MPELTTRMFKGHKFEWANSFRTLEMARDYAKALQSHGCYIRVTEENDDVFWPFAVWTRKYEAGHNKRAKRR